MIAFPPRIRLLACLALTPISAGGATIHDHNTWVNFSLTGPLLDGQGGASRWRFTFDSPNRFGDNSRQYAQGAWRAGLGYALNSHWSIWAGGSYTRTDTPYSSVPYGEPRGFQQVLWTDRSGDFILQYRLRLEERFPDTGNDLGLRLRQQFRVSHPLPAFKPLSWVLWEELFLNLNETDYGARRGLDQNRAFVGLGWTWSEIVRSEAGYLHHFNRRPGRVDGVNHTLAVSLAITFK